MKFTQSDSETHQALADRLWIPLDELRHLAAHAGIAAIAAHLQDGKRIELPLQLGVAGASPRFPKSIAVKLRRGSVRDRRSPRNVLSFRKIHGARETL